MKILKNKKGFTLIELLIAITILVIVVAIMISIFGKTDSGATGEATRILDTGRQIAQAEEMYYAKNGTYTTNMQDLFTAKYLKTVPNTDWTLNNTTYNVFDNSTAANDFVVVYTPTDAVGNDICIKIAKKENYGGLYKLITHGSTNANDVVNDESDCTDGTQYDFLYLVEANEN